ncbi:hypothetical protein OG948_13320 [Embleya sp. NBC_00888]|uniref:hypothetical protein n=1 Tax=Embleya sp. NBC_00888 TaxID=2975960 RepID=UPI00386A8C08|nr:hypothetical protein OG948_13320 [Embleya sp. NBC_00888]
MREVSGRGPAGGLGRDRARNGRADRAAHPPGGVRHARREPGPLARHPRRGRLGDRREAGPDPEFGAIPGFATRLLTGPHRDAGHLRIQDDAVAAFMLGGADRERARQYWYVLAAAVPGWTAIREDGRLPADPPMDFEVLLDVLTRGYQA